MKKINKDYISIVRNHSGRLHYERIPMLKSDKVKLKLIAMAENENLTIEDMRAYLIEEPIFAYMAAPYYEAPKTMDFNSLASWRMKSLADDLKDSKTKVKFLENALKLIEECDYRWNVIRIARDMPDVILRSHVESENAFISVRLTNDTSVLFESEDIDDEYAGTLSYTVYRNEIPVLPYRSLVQMYQCSEYLTDSTKVFDSESAQMDNAFKSLVATANAIIDDEEAFFKENVIEAGQEMLEKIKMMCLDKESYYNWIESVSKDTVVDFSECEKGLDSLYNQDESNRHLYELYVMGDKMNSALSLAENLEEWSKMGLAYSGLANALTDLRSMAKCLLQKIREICDGLPREAFEDFYGEGDFVKRELGEDARALCSVCEKLEESLSKQQNIQDPELQ
jgi:hypothetical protein